MDAFKQKLVTFNNSNLDEWKKLKDKVKYIWVQNCVAGAGIYTMAMIAKTTGAWVSAPVGFTGWPNDTGAPKGHIECFDMPKINYWNGQNIDLSTCAPISDTDEFFRSARYSTAASLDGSALYFNVVQFGHPLSQAILRMQGLGG